MLDIIFVLVTGAIAYHGLTFRDEEGESEIGHLLFGSIVRYLLILSVFSELLFFITALFFIFLGYPQQTF